MSIIKKILIEYILFYNINIYKRDIYYASNFLILSILFFSRLDI
jgi:hypothetical protein